MFHRTVENGVRNRTAEMGGCSGGDEARTSGGWRVPATFRTCCCEVWSEMFRKSVREGRLGF